MKNNLPANIKTLRKERGLTQEQLADVFGVTIGAVHKWEAGLSTPDLSIMMEMADFFDISLDVLVGFDLKDNRVDVLSKQLRKLTDNMDPSGPDEAEKALKKYPNNFMIVYESAYLYRAFGAMLKIDKKLCTRSKELYEQAIRLVSQNKDPNIDETALYGQLASVYMMMGDLDTALEIYKAHNAGYIYNSQIGQILLQKEEYKDAQIHLSYALVNEIGSMINLIISKALCYIKTKNFDDARAIIQMGLSNNEYCKREDKISYLDRIDSLYLTGLAFIELELKNKKKATEYLKKAKQKADLFDAAPDYDARNERFIDINEKCVAFDTTGETCIEGVENAIRKLNSDELLKIWKSINK